MTAEPPTTVTAQPSTTDILGAALGVREAARHAVREKGGADAVLTALSALIDHDHAALSRWDPLLRRHVTLAGSYPARTTRYIETRLHDDPAFALIRHTPGTTSWWHDVPAPVRGVSTGFQEVLEPLGVQDGVAQCLFTADGRYVGILNVSTTRARCDQPAVRAVMTLLGECLAAVADPLAGHRSQGPGGTGHTCAVLLPDADGAEGAEEAAPVPLSGEPLPGLTEPGSPLVTLLRRTAARRTLPATVLVPYRQRMLELHLTRQGDRTIVVCRTVTRPAALSPRELEVLAELTQGRTNREIADRLYVSPRTVATHIEHILAKLDVPNRVAAAGRAVAWGLEPAP
ncbi:helix-turn-helix transcriptional regulator [Streptomyces hesseae]|uniref:LuxR C-terminal-related transcriptional regulator n=1 Tax=Streptomyces hesseae TaxID=3075519 RepID=A0ABU2SHW5_9ACTN|nr:LuxR C-terminal-related transcriptional regulator [Streptomyces sp. DSM 40473]MDT0448231.1 LuxR C-terminal-related transcriptional regulator [Streptomyces sp. DSM 40473]